MMLRLVAAALVLACAGSLTGIAQPPRASDAAGVTTQQTPVRLLILFPLAGERPGEAVLLKDLKKLPRTGWMLNVQRADGSLTGFVSRDGLAGALAQTAPGQDFDAQLDAAIDELVRDPQNSTVLFASKVQPTFQRPKWTYPLVQKGVPIYVVDGGQSSRVTYNEAWGYTRSGGAPSYDTEIKDMRFITGEILHEVNLKNAVKDIKKDRKNGYKPLHGRSN